MSSVCTFLMRKVHTCFIDFFLKEKGDLTFYTAALYHRFFFHGLWTPNPAFLYHNPELLCLERQVGQINSGPFGVFLAKLSVPILVQWVPGPCFLLFNHYFCSKLSLYIHIPNNYLRLGFEFGPQRIRDLAFVCP